MMALISHTQLVQRSHRCALTKTQYTPVALSVLRNRFACEPVRVSDTTKFPLPNPVMPIYLAEELSIFE